MDDHASTQTRWRGMAGGATLTGPATVLVELEFVEDVSGGAGVILTVGAGNGIVPAAGGAAWAGVANLGLPFA